MKFNCLIGAQKIVICQEFKVGVIVFGVENYCDHVEGFDKSGTKFTRKMCWMWSAN